MRPSFQIARIHCCTGENEVAKLYSNVNASAAWRGQSSSCVIRYRRDAPTIIQRRRPRPHNDSIAQRLLRSVCYPSPSATAAFQIDIWFNHVAGALLPSPVSANENGRLGHDHKLIAHNALLALVAWDSQDQLTYIAYSIASCYCSHRFIGFLRERSSKPLGAGQDHP
jgi:hypothetical protein